MKSRSPLNEIYKKGLYGDYENKNEENLIKIQEVSNLSIFQIVKYKNSKVSTNDLDVETLSALEYAISEFAGSAMVISHDRFFLNRICTHILAFEGDSHVEWFEGDYDDYIKDKKRRLGEDAVNPKRTKYRKFVV